MNEEPKLKSDLNISNLSAYIIAAFAFLLMSCYYTFNMLMRDGNSDIYRIAAISSIGFMMYLTISAFKFLSLEIYTDKIEIRSVIGCYKQTIFLSAITG
jgi:bacteriorhodopsin